MMAVRGLGLAAIMLLGAALPAAAQSLYTPEPFAGIVDELRIGLHAHQVHHAALPFMVSDWDISRVEDISFDVLFTSPDLDVFRWVGYLVPNWAPRSIWPAATACCIWA